MKSVRSFRVGMVVIAYRRFAAGCAINCIVTELLPSLSSDSGNRRMTKGFSSRSVAVGPIHRFSPQTSDVV